MNKLTQAFILLLLLAFSASAKADFYLVANNSIGIESLDKSEIKSIFLGRKKLWPNKSLISTCYLSPDHAVTQVFFSAIIKKDHASFVRYWNKKLFSGSGNPPIVVESVDDLFIYVKRNKGAICFINDRPEKLPDNVGVIRLKY